MAKVTSEKTISKYQAGSRILHRTDINKAPYNPRKISDKAFKALVKNLKERGLMGGIVVNEVTMNLVSGHQRLAALDHIQKGTDYYLRVDIVNLTEKQEKEQNLFMNNRRVQGEFDEDMIAAMLPDIDYKEAGLVLSDFDLPNPTSDYEFESSSYNEPEEEDEDSPEDILDKKKPQEKNKKQEPSDGLVPLYINVSKADLANFEKIVKQLKISQRETFKKIIDVYNSTVLG